jgi:hypothetical protein
MFHKIYPELNLLKPCVIRFVSTNKNNYDFLHGMNVFVKIVNGKKKTWKNKILWTVG